MGPKKLFILSFCIFFLCEGLFNGRHLILDAPKKGQGLSSSFAATGPKEKKRGIDMMTAQIIESIKRKDWKIIDQKGLFTPEIGSNLLPLLEEKDPEVRELTLHCLNASGGKAARQGFLKALNDAHDMVRAAASRFLHNNYSQEDLPVFLKEVKDNADEYVREQVALILGKIGDPRAIEVLQKQYTKEIDAHAKHGMFLALVRLKDSASRQKYISMLQNPDLKERVQALKDLVYIADQSMVPYIRPLLDDLRSAVNVAPAGYTYFIRVCDVAINTLDVLLNHPFPFKVDQIKQYSPEELTQAKFIISKIK